MAMTVSPADESNDLVTDPSLTESSEGPVDIEVVGLVPTNVLPGY